jgi:hypothetical protein
MLRRDRSGRKGTPTTRQARCEAELEDFQRGEREVPFQLAQITKGHPKLACKGVAVRSKRPGGRRLSSLCYFPRERGLSDDQVLAPKTTTVAAIESQNSINGMSTNSVFVSP